MPCARASCATSARSTPVSTFMGHKLRIPCLLAPIGSLQTITPEGGVAVAKAAAEFGTVNLVSTVTEPTLEEIAQATEPSKDFPDPYPWRRGLGRRADRPCPRRRLRGDLPDRRFRLLRQARTPAHNRLAAAQHPALWRRTPARCKPASPGNGWTGCANAAAYPSS